jgi:hypothetical protein
MTGVARAPAALVLLLLAGCGALDPFPTVPEAAAPGGPAGRRIGICYNALTSSKAELQQEAQRQCGPGTEARRVETDWHLETCPLLLPARASFACTK